MHPFDESSRLHPCWGNRFLHFCTTLPPHLGLARQQRLSDGVRARHSSILDIFQAFNICFGAILRSRQLLGDLNWQLPSPEVCTGFTPTTGCAHGCQSNLPNRTVSWEWALLPYPHPSHSQPTQASAAFYPRVALQWLRAIEAVTFNGTIVFK